MSENSQPPRLAHNPEPIRLSKPETVQLLNSAERVSRNSIRNFITASNPLPSIRSKISNFFAKHPKIRYGADVLTSTWGRRTRDAKLSFTTLNPLQQAAWNRMSTSEGRAETRQRLRQSLGSMINEGGLKYGSNLWNALEKEFKRHNAEDEVQKLKSRINGILLPHGINLESGEGIEKLQQFFQAWFDTFFPESHPESENRDSSNPSRKVDPASEPLFVTSQMENMGLFNRLVSPGDRFSLISYISNQEVGDTAQPNQPAGS